MSPRLPRKRGGDPRDARAYIRPLGNAKEAETQGTPGRTSDPLAMHIVPRLPRKRGGDPRDARAYIRPLGSAHCPTPATQKRRRPRDARAYIRRLGNAHCPTPATHKRRRPKGRQGVHPTPWQCTLSHACHAKEAETQGTPGRTPDPLAVHIVPRLPRIVPRLPRKRGGDPRDARAYIRPLGSAHCPTPATHCLPRKRGGDPRDARAYIRPLGSAHCPTPATQKMRRPKGCQGVHPTPSRCALSHACHAKEGRQGVHPTPWQCKLFHACHAKEAEPDRE